ncbi:MAG: dipeptidase [Planctomycetota bacterium]
MRSAFPCARLLSNALVLLAYPAFAQERSGDTRKPVVITDSARELHHSSLLIDGHNDLPWQMRKEGSLSFEKLDISKSQPKLHTDIPRLRMGGVGAQFWSAYVEADTIDSKDAVRQTLEQIDVIHRMIRRYPETFALALSADDILRIRKEGKIACMIGVEGGHSIDNSLAVLRAYYQLGVRYMTLTHSRSLDWADSATDEAKSDGLSPFGRDVVREMNRLGMLVDISHVSVATMRDAIETSTAPVFASHSSAHAIAQHPRNIPDEILLEMKAKGGVVMVNFFSGFIVPEGARQMTEMFHAGRELKKRHRDPKEFEAAMAQWHKEHPYPAGTVHTLVDHIDHIVKTAGIDHVGLGSDFDGVTKLPGQLQDVSTYPVITQALLDRGYTPEGIRKVLGENLMSILRKAEAIRGKL